MTISVKEHVKSYNARFGYNKVFGLDVDERKAFSETQAIERFDRTWEERLCEAIGNAEPISVEDARGLLKAKNLAFVRDDEEQRRFWLAGGLFVAQLRHMPDNSKELTQLWFIPSSNPDPRTLYVTFDSVDVKTDFCELATEIGWKAEELGEHLLLQFMETMKGMNSQQS